MAKIQIGALDRVMRIQAAQHEGAERLRQQTAAIAQELLGESLIRHDEAVRPHAYPDTGYLTPYDATIALAVELHRAISWHATNEGRKAPPLTKYHPAYATPAMLKDVWEARQLCDSAGIPYAFFAQQSVMRWESLKRSRLPRPTQLCAPEVMTHVADMWADPKVRLHHPLPSAAIDERFDPSNYTGDNVQTALLALIDERVAFASRVGMPVEDVVAAVLGTNISEVEARRRYGSDVVDRALSIQAPRQDELEDLVRGSPGADDADTHEPNVGK